MARNVATHGKQPASKSTRALANVAPARMSRESIYEWIKPEPEPPAKAPLYRSKHSPSSPLTGSTIKVQKKQYSTLGAELKGTVRPESFLRAHEKTGFVDTMSIRE